MKMIKWEPFKEVDRFFDDSFFPYFPKLTQLGLDLAVDMYEEKDNIIAKMNLPGVTPNELDISIENNILTVSGRREEETEIDEKDYYSKEIRRGSFSRSVSLPKSVDADKSEATYEKGELVIAVPVIPGIDDKSVKVEIKS